MHTQQTVFTQYMCNRALYMYINVCRYIHPHWKPLYILCSWSGYGPLCQIFVYGLSNVVSGDTHTNPLYLGVIGKQEIIIWSSCGRNPTWQMLRQFVGVFFGVPMKATRNLSHDSAYSDRDSNREYLEYGPAMLLFSQLAHFVTEVVRGKQSTGIPCATICYYCYN
jgi:hypothetical protein